MKRERMRKMLSYLTLSLTLLLGMLMFGCEGDKGDRGFPGANGTSFGTLTGTVTDTAVPPHNLAGITVSPSPSVSGVASVTTDANGKYSLTIPNGNYTINYSKAGYASASQSATVVSTQTTTLPSIALQQTSALSAGRRKPMVVVTTRRYLVRSSVRPSSARP